MSNSEDVLKKEEKKEDTLKKEDNSNKEVKKEEKKEDNPKKEVKKEEENKKRIKKDPVINSIDNIDNIDKDHINLIEVKIKRINQLFNSFDPSPFLEKDLDDDAFEYIFSSVSEHSMRRKHKIIIHMPLDQKKKVSEHEIKKAMKNFFEYKRNIADKNIHMKLQEGQLSFIVGISFLAFCLFLGNFISSQFDTLFANVIVEGLVIGGWVAMWKPISNILYDWWPAHKEKKIFEKIAAMNIEFIYT